MEVFSNMAELEFNARLLRTETPLSSVHSDAAYRFKQWLLSDAQLPSGMLKWLTEVSTTPQSRDLCFYPDSAELAERIGFITTGVINGQRVDVLTPVGAMVLA